MCPQAWKALLNHTRLSMYDTKSGLGMGKEESLSAQSEEFPFSQASLALCSQVEKSKAALVPGHLCHRPAT